MIPMSPMNLNFAFPLHPQRTPMLAVDLSNGWNLYGPTTVQFSGHGLLDSHIYIICHLGLREVGTEVDSGENSDQDVNKLYQARTKETLECNIRPFSIVYN